MLHHICVEGNCIEHLLDQLLLGGWGKPADCSPGIIRKIAKHHFQLAGELPR